MSTHNLTPAQAREEWAKALRSGAYRQGWHELRSDPYYNPAVDNVQFCCLGVACDLFAKLEPQTNAHWDPDGQFVVPGLDQAYSTLPQVVTDWLGLTDKCGIANLRNAETGYFWHQHLTSINDEEGWTFEQIANLIEGGDLVIQE